MIRGRALRAESAHSAQRLRQSLNRRPLRRPAPQAHAFWRIGFPALVVVAATAAALLTWQGTKTVADSTIGQVDVSHMLSPDDPGYLAFVAPTPTLLALHTHGGSLVGVTLLAVPDAQSPAAAVLIGSELLVGYEPDASTPLDAVSDGAPIEAPAQTLAQAYASGGAEVVVPLAEALFGVGFGEVVEVATADLAAAMTPAQPLKYTLADDLVESGADGTERAVYLSGLQDVSAASAADVYRFRNPGEADANRVQRQLALWESWLDSIRRADDPDAAVLPFETGLSPFLRALASAEATVEAVPARPAVGAGGELPVYSLDEAGRDWALRRARELVPWPDAPSSFVRSTVLVLDGVGDQALRDAIAHEVVSAGGIVTLIGNAERMDQNETLVAYHRPEAEPAAEAIAVALRSGGEAAGMAFVEAAADAEYWTDITVTIGRDLAAR